MKLELLPETFAISRLAPREPLPAWAAAASDFSCVTRTREELSIVCEAALIPTGVRCEGPWRALRVAGTLDFALTGVLSRLSLPLAEAEISIFAVSTFDTDYLLIRASALEAALAALRPAGFEIAASSKTK